MSDELTKCATRILAGREPDSFLLSDARRVAANYLSEHDEEANNPAWMRAVGFTMPPENNQCPFIFSPPSAADEGLRLSFELGTGRLCLEVGTPSDSEISYELPEALTRGDVRRLCQCLGIPLRESTP